MELEMIRTIQGTSTPFLDAFFELVTILGEETFIIPLLALIYWALDKRLGEIVAFTVFTSYLFNNSLKDLFRFERPIGKEGIRTLRAETATGYSFPSGHAQGSAALMGSISLYLRKRFFYFLSGMTILLVSFSRLYLGVHYPKDVLAGIVLGLMTSWICAKLFRRVDKRKLYAIVLVVSLLALSFSHSLDFIKAIGSYAGFFLGILLEKRYVNFTTDGTLLRKILRVGIGVALLLGIKVGLKALFPDELFFHFIRYFTLTFFAIGLYPALFKKLRL
jgi:membrane-associated phospholipid phosphatase